MNIQELIFIMITTATPVNNGEMISDTLLMPFGSVEECESWQEPEPLEEIKLNVYVQFGVKVDDISDCLTYEEAKDLGADI